MQIMTEPAWRDFVMTGTRTGKLAVTRRDGRPHVTAVWFVLDGGDVVFTTPADSVKGRVLRREGQAMLCVDDQQPPYSFVLIEGPVSVSEDPGELLHWAGVIGGRYMGASRAAEYGERNGVPGELLVRLRIAAVVARAGIAD
ncbi:MAG TPA: PPOX class F420-dependent oxidoreductase [Streptosporangiaceae bacterium]